jgi:hypothetical protein
MLARDREQRLAQHVETLPERRVVHRATTGRAGSRRDGPANRSHSTPLPTGPRLSSPKRVRARSTSHCETAMRV